MLYEVSCPLFEIDPKLIRVEPVNMTAMVSLQKQMSKAIWRPSPGRGLPFVVLHDWKLIGLINLASPVINLGPRDEYLKMPKDPVEKGKALRNYMDMSVCVGVQPLSWYWNIGKLLALLAPTLGDFYLKQYGDELKGITTTSLWGRGTQYNRIYEFIGYTKGFGHEQYDDVAYHKMTAWLLKEGHGLSPYKTNLRMSNIQRYAKLSGDKSITSFHGKKRGIYYHEAVSPSERSSVIQGWFDRWGKRRYDAKKTEKPPYEDGLSGEPA